MPYAPLAEQRLEAARQKASVRILAIETSCDETAAAIVENGRRILSNAVFSQIDLHVLYGGVVPEIASRAHVEACAPVVDEALKAASLTLDEVDAIAVTYGPGLVGALLTGVAYAKALAFAKGLPLIGVNHIEGHVSANFLTHPALEPPFLCLIVSGGHSHIVQVSDYGVYKVIGRTCDDAAGEAFDKAARVLGLPYPGGPMIDSCAENGDPSALWLPKPKTENPYDFSFSGLKTAFINAVRKNERSEAPLCREDLAASFREAVVCALVDKTLLAAREMGAPALALAGGVACNKRLRQLMQSRCDALGLRLYMPLPELCTDNAAMIGSAAYFRMRRGEAAGLELNAVPYLPLA